MEELRPQSSTEKPGGALGLDIDMLLSPRHPTVHVPMYGSPTGKGGVCRHPRHNTSVKLFWPEGFHQ